MTDDSHTAYEPHPTAAMDRQYRERDDEYAKLWQMYGELDDKCDRLLDEMRRYLPVIERCEGLPALWNHCTRGTGIATANGYRTALQEAGE